MAKKSGAEVAAKVEKLTFQCRVCGKSKQIDEMVVITRYFPPVVACRDCEEKMR